MADPRNADDSIGTVDGLRKELAEFDTAMLSTITSDGLIRARPMAMQDLSALSGEQATLDHAGGGHRDQRLRHRGGHLAPRLWLGESLAE